MSRNITRDGLRVYAVIPEIRLCVREPWCWDLTFGRHPALYRKANARPWESGSLLRCLHGRLATFFLRLVPIWAGPGQVSGTGVVQARPRDELLIFRFQSRVRSDGKYISLPRLA